ncbi:MAG: hypothetical protein JW729_09705 [Bacteroidales bacterium]|nr:hypothetical protein [Bacteroidales bacterium]
MIKKILYISIWTLSLLAVMAFEIYALQQSANTNCTGLDVKIANKKNVLLLTSAEELKTTLLQNYLPIEGQKIKNLNLEQIEKDVDDITYLQTKNAYFLLNGKLAIQTTPRKATIRVYNAAGQHFYLGEDTVVMPLSNKHTVRLPLASGALPRLDASFFNSTNNQKQEIPLIYKKIYNLAAKIQQDEFLSALIDQIYVTSENNIELIPKVGVEIIEFGDIEFADKKLKRLKNFYINGKEKINWTLYKSINLEYENQVVCTKK